MVAQNNKRAGTNPAPTAMGKLLGKMIMVQRGQLCYNSVMCNQVKKNINYMHPLWKESFKVIIIISLYSLRGGIYYAL